MSLFGDHPPVGLSFIGILLVTTACFACKNPQNGASSPSSTKSSADKPSSESSADDDQDRSDSERFEELREAMVRDQIASRDVDDSEVLEAMRTVPRHRFVPENLRSRSYQDRPLPIGHDQTISQPYIVAAMSQALDVDSSHNVLEIGTGSGYQAAILSRLAGEVYSIEIICELADRARKTLEDLEFEVTVRCGDGYQGWPEHAPFDRIIVTAAPPEIPEALVEQLRPGGRMVLPVGERSQELKVVEKTEDGEIETVEMMRVRFVPMVRGEKDAE